MGQSLEDASAENPNGLLALIGRCTSRLARVISDVRDRAALRAEFVILLECGVV